MSYLIFMWREKNMSCWTQVAAVIRVDDLRFDEKYVLDDDLREKFERM